MDFDGEGLIMSPAQLFIWHKLNKLIPIQLHHNFTLTAMVTSARQGHEVSWSPLTTLYIYNSLFLSLPA